MVLNEAGVKAFFQNVGIGIGNFNGKEKLPRSYKERKTGHYLYLYFFCVTWKNEGVSLLKATEKVKKVELLAACFIYDNVDAYEN